MVNLVISTDMDVKKNSLQKSNQRNKSTRPTFFLVVDSPKLTEITQLVNQLLQNITKFIAAVDSRTYSVDEIFTTLVTKTNLAIEIFESYIQCCNLNTQEFDEPKKMVDDVLKKCDEALQNPYITDADHKLLFTSFADDLRDPLKQAKAILSQSLYFTDMASSTSKIKLLTYSDKIVQLLDYGIDRLRNFSLEHKDNENQVYATNSL